MAKWFAQRWLPSFFIALSLSAPPHNLSIFRGVRLLDTTQIITSCRTGWKTKQGGCLAEA